MTLKKAMKILHEDMLFLGMDWERFFQFIQQSPGAQKSSVLAAFDVYRAHVEGERDMER
jgi:hypothetical protein